MKISDYYNMNIYSDKASFVGQVQDVVISDEEGRVIGLAFEQRGDKVATIPYDSIMAIGDIVLVKSKTSEPAPEPKAEETEI